MISTSVIASKGPLTFGNTLVTNYVSIHALPVLDLWPWSCRQ